MGSFGSEAHSSLELSLHQFFKNFFFFTHATDFAEKDGLLVFLHFLKVWQ